MANKIVVYIISIARIYRRACSLHAALTISIIDWSGSAYISLTQFYFPAAYFHLLFFEFWT